MFPNIPGSAHPIALFHGRERDQDFFFAVLCDTSLGWDKSKGSEGHLGCVFGAALLPLSQVLHLRVHWLVYPASGKIRRGRFSPALPPHPALPPSCLLQQFWDPWIPSGYLGKHVLVAKSARPPQCLESRQRFLGRFYSSPPRADSHEQHGRWEKMGQLLKDYSAPVVWKLTPEKLQDTG